MLTIKERCWENECKIRCENCISCVEKENGIWFCTEFHLPITKVVDCYENAIDRRITIVEMIKGLCDDYLDYVFDFECECAYTDDMIGQIKCLAESIPEFEIEKDS